MKRISFYLIVSALLLLLSTNISAVERKGKKSLPKDTSSQQQDRANSLVAPADTQQPTDQDNRKYDNFVDENGNGVDDRRENLISKEQDSNNPPDNKQTEQKTTDTMATSKTSR